MLKKVFAAVACAAIAGTLAAETPYRSFTLEPMIFSVKAGEPVVATAAFECADGCELAGWSCYIHRKDAPAEFFASPELAIRKHASAPAYDAVYAGEYLRFPKALAAGTFPVRLNTAGLKPGDYAFRIQGHFMENGKSVYSAIALPVSITSGDGGKFAPTPQVPPDAAKAASQAAPATPAAVKNCELFELNPAHAEVTAGDKLTVAGRIKALPGRKLTGWYVCVSRRNVPAAFFARPGVELVKHPTLPAYDTIFLRKYVPETPAETLNFNYELDTMGFPEGHYVLSFVSHFTDPDKKISCYPSVSFELDIKNGK